MTILRDFVLVIAATILCSSNSAANAARLRVLAIGIDQYAHLKTLEGAVADAEDVAQAFRAIGGEVTLLRNGQATRRRIEDAWAALSAKSSSGDVLVFYFAGHGGQAKDQVPLDEADGLDETFLLSGFRPLPSAPGWAERIIDDEIYKWLKVAADKRVKVILIADACHAGGLGRSTSGGGQERFYPPYGLEDININPRPVISEEREIPGVLQILAVSEGSKAPEVLIGGRRRGALSYALSRGIEGKADFDSNGRLTAEELQRFLAPQVNIWSDGQQVPDFLPARLPDVDLFPAKEGPGLTTAYLAPPIRVAVTRPEDFASVPMIEGVSFQKDDVGADLRWSESSGNVVSANGDVIAIGISSGRLMAVIDKWRAIIFLKHLSAAGSVNIELSRGANTNYYAGEEFRIATGVLPADHFVAVLGLAADGEVSILHPSKDERFRSESEVGKLFRDLPFQIPRVKVVPPFGADHVVAIVSSKPLEGIFKIGATLTARALPAVLGQVLDGAEYKIGIVGIYTRDGARPARN